MRTELNFDFFFAIFVAAAAAAVLKPSCMKTVRLTISVYPFEIDRFKIVRIIVLSFYFDRFCFERFTVLSFSISISTFYTLPSFVCVRDFRKIFQVFALAWTHSDLLGCMRTQPDAFGTI